jgi:hypothetical protein
MVLIDCNFPTYFKIYFKEKKSLVSFFVVSFVKPLLQNSVHAVQNSELKNFGHLFPL